MDDAFKIKMLNAQIGKACSMALDETDGVSCKEYCLQTLRFIKQANEERALLDSALAEQDKAEPQDAKERAEAVAEGMAGDTALKNIVAAFDHAITGSSTPRITFHKTRAIQYRDAILKVLASPPPARIDEPDIGKLCAALVDFDEVWNLALRTKAQSKHADTIAFAREWMKNNDNG